MKQINIFQFMRICFFKYLLCIKRYNINGIPIGAESIRKVGLI